METFKFTGSSCLKLAEGSTIKDLAAFVKGVSFHLTGCEEPTGRLCDALAAFSAPSVLPSLRVCKPSSLARGSPPAPHLRRPYRE